jgi:antitoxin (DNA-binding transcriptional repressor) of toxin-antitoxin stability system
MAKRTYPLRIEPWSAVRIATHGEPCARAVAMRDKRLLARDAPALPLKGCTMSATCQCMYRHYADRRAGPRRTDAPTESWKPDATGERRASRGPRGRRDPG